MNTARSFVRLAISGFILSAVAAACTVEEAPDPCTPGETQKCDCKDGSESTQICRDDGEKFGACDCPDETGGGGNGAGGNGSGTGGDDGKPTAGTGNSGGDGSQAGSSSGGAGGDESSGGANSLAGAGGAGGDDLPIECQLPADPTTCEICYFGGCCDQWAPCVNDDDCLREYQEVLDCTNEIRVTRNVTTGDLEDCAKKVGETSGSWSASLSALTVDMVDCVAGEDGWEGNPWGTLACKAECFDKE